MNQQQANNSTLLGVLSGKDAIKFEVTANRQTLIYLGLAVFAAVLLGTAAAIYLTRKTA